MLQIQEKTVVCQTHKALLYLLVRYGNGALPLPLLRTLAVQMRLYPNGQAVNKAVRELREAGVLDRQTWVDNNSDLILVRKFALRFLFNKTSQEIATPQRPRTMAPYILQARKVDWLLGAMEKKHLDTLMSVETFMKKHACSLFCRLPMLPAYYRDYAGVLEREKPGNYREQLARLEGEPQTNPGPTLEQLHRRGIYITDITPQKRTIQLVSFPGREMGAERVMDWTIEAHQWAVSLLPYYHTYHFLCVLDGPHKEALRAALTATAPDTTATAYWDYRLQGARLSGAVQIGVTDSDFIKKWCGNIRRTGI